jgi:uncharacterized tellurite resistance protein B-like protein
VKEDIFAWLGLGGAKQEEEKPDTNRAAAALMTEVMAVDNDWHDLEVQRIEELLQTSLGLPQSEAAEIVAEVLELQKKRHDLFQFTSSINEHYSQLEKFELLKNLWKVAYADGRVDAYEEHIIRRLADLIHMPHNQFIKAKIDARQH